MKDVRDFDFLKLMDQHHSLVTKIARFMAGKLPSSVQLDDLVQSGIIGLMEAYQHFDESHGVSFESFASFRIKGAMIDDLRKMDWTPRSVHRDARQIDQMIDALEQKNNGCVTDQMVAEALQISLKQYQKLLADINYRRLLSTDELEEREGEAFDTGLRASPLFNPEYCVEQDDFSVYLAQVIEQLSPQEKMVLKFYYNDDLNLKEISDILNVSESRISQIHRQAVHILKTELAMREGD